MRLLIVDDERKLREGLANGVNWKRVGISEVYMAENGLDALAQYKKWEHEIIITDIRMPGMDGLELSDKIIKFGNHTQIIIISGFSEFEYAKKAMKLGVTDYELKPVDIQNLMKLVADARDKILKARAEEETENKHQVLYFNDLLEKIVTREKEAYGGTEKDLLKSFGFNEDTYSLCVVMDFGKNAITQDSDYFNNLADKVKLIIAKYFKDVFLLFKNNNNHFVTVLKSRFDYLDSMTQASIGSIQKELLNTLYGQKTAVSFGISDIGRIKGVSSLYHQAMESLRHKLYKGDSSMTFYKDTMGQGNEALSNPSYEAEIKNCIRAFDYVSAERIIVNEFDRLKSEKCSNNDFVRNFCIDLKNILIRTITGMNIDFYNIFKDNSAIIEYVPWCDTIDEYARWTLNTYYVVSKGLSDFNAVKHNKLMYKAVEYIKTHYSGDLTIQELADHMQKSPNYFSHLFKKEYGIGFSEFVNKLRIEEAIRLIQNTSLLLYEISEKVGFSDYDYFKQVFKKITGHSPSELKKSDS